jgi:hypothetical protein
LIGALQRRHARLYASVATRQLARSMTRHAMRRRRRHVRARTHGICILTYRYSSRVKTAARVLYCYLGQGHGASWSSLMAVSCPAPNMHAPWRRSHMYHCIACADADKDWDSIQFKFSFNGHGRRPRRRILVHALRPAPVIRTVVGPPIPLPDD